LKAAGPFLSLADREYHNETHLVTATLQAIPLPERVSRDFLLHHRICPQGLRSDGLVAIAVAEGSRLEALDDLAIAFDCAVVPVPVPDHELDLLLARLASTDDETIELGRAAEEDDRFAPDVRDLANQPPVIRYVNLLIRDAHEARASDIHLEATRKGVRARLRLDGVLQPGMNPPPGLDRAVVSRVKLLADLDIAERRRPQDGRIRVRLRERELDLRISTAPTVHGESVVLRLLERGGGAIALDSLGLAPAHLAAMKRLARRPHGMLLATGPTGSGKTTTLYSALGLRDAAAEKIVTLEDPVEYTLDGITQVPIHAQTGVTFASMLRSILRQDPDVLLVGEMRGAETAELAVQASLTGHVVFSTLHTSDAIGAVPRLLDLGVPPYLITATLQAVLAQRLVRRICDACRDVHAPDPDATALLVAETGTRPEALARGRGCDQCRHTGYRGRTGLFELLELTDELREAVADGATRDRLAQIARAAGMQPLRMDGWAKALAGETTVEEVLRVSQE
jgi:general secretion pathway protein E